MNTPDLAALDARPRVYVIRWPGRNQTSLVFSRDLAELRDLAEALGGAADAEFIAIDHPFGVRLAPLSGPQHGYRTTCPLGWEEAIGGLTSHDLVDEARWIRMADVPFAATAAPMRVGA